MSDTNKLEITIQEYGKQVFEDLKSQGDTVLHANFYTDKLLSWGMSDENIKLSLFRFVDVLPTLRTSSSLIRHVQEYFSPIKKKIPDIFSLGLKVKDSSVAAKAAAPIIRKQIRSIANRFILGESAEDSLKNLQKIRKLGLAFTVDLLGEATLSENEALSYKNKYLELIETLSNNISKWDSVNEIVKDHWGEKTPINISVKLSSLYSQIKPTSYEKNVKILSERFAEILSKAKECDAFVYLDMEDSSMTEITIDVFKNVLEKDEFKKFENAGIVIQSYLRRTEKDLDELISWAKKRETPFAIRLVKGAYWDTEVILAKQRSWPIPVWQEKSSTDANFEKLAKALLENHKIIHPAFGSHNVRSFSYIVCLAEELGLSKSDYELQTLFGMGDGIKRTFADKDLLIREYAPIGEFLPGMSYFVRRLLENTANESFLRQSFHEKEDKDLLLKKPEMHPEDDGLKHLEVDVRKSFSNTALLDFTNSDIRNNFLSALEKIKNSLRQMPVSITPVVDGKRVATFSAIKTTSPEDKELILGEVHLATEALSDEALTSLEKYFPSWCETPVEHKADILFNTAEIIKRDRFELASLIVLEAGKQWEEADADVAEAIDFRKLLCT